MQAASHVIVKERGREGNKDKLIPKCLIIKGNKEKKENNLWCYKNSHLARRASKYLSAEPVAERRKSKKRYVE